MTPIEPRLPAVRDAVIAHVKATVESAADQVLVSLSQATPSDSSVGERELVVSCRVDLRRNMGNFRRTFAQTLDEKFDQALAPRAQVRHTPAATNWQTLSLVDDSAMDERVVSDRIGQMIAHACESELRELATYAGSLRAPGSADDDHDPLRAEILAAALYRAVESVSTEPESRKLLSREFGKAMARSMPECYTQILEGLKSRGVQPTALTVRTVEGPGNQLPGITSGYASLTTTRSGPHSDYQASSSTEGFHSGFTTGSAGLRSGNTGSGATPHSGPGRYGAGPHAPPGSAASQADAQLMMLLRRLTAVASRPCGLDALPSHVQNDGHDAGGHSRTHGARSSGRSQPYGTDGLPGLMAVNLIRAHREELLQASTGQLDHMVIDVVGSLFDQILSDTRVPPQMARQIARLQLPVLRVALSDTTFFSSRRHPVRRFVNRIASLACAFDDFDDGPGKQLLARVQGLVQEIVEGDFDQIEVYASKLALLEAFISEQTHTAIEHQGTVSTLHSKESELRVQQRYMLKLRAALAPMALPDYLSAFLPQIWSQAIVLAVSRDGADSDRATRFRRVGRDLVMSVQPKGSPALRKAFLMQLPALVKDLNEGLQLIGWPDAAQREFFSKLLPAHAESLKGKPQSELDHNMLVKQLESVFNIVVPSGDALSAYNPLLDIEPEVLASRFSPAEAKSVGLVDETAVDWSGKVDIDLGEEVQAQLDAHAQAAAPTAAELALGIDLDLNTPHAEPPEPTRGAQLIDHVNLGFAYQMHLKDQWQKVRLAHVSAGRGFFVFTAGRRHQETISMTSRMLARMCETGRMRAVESSYLMERATLRARKQLAELNTPSRI